MFSVCDGAMEGHSLSGTAYTAMLFSLHVVSSKKENSDCFNKLCWAFSTIKLTIDFAVDCREDGRGVFCRILQQVSTYHFLLHRATTKLLPVLGVSPICEFCLHGATRGVTVSMPAFLACHQCYCAGLSLAWGLNLRAVVCGIF